ncbi:hypothetical protein BDZ89DRAFT_1076854 [Hymenopellis radicata]|nr:hypothetical protein BDZ89DRAFT_1076854 [Hymenopellis radicata]
MSLDEGTRYALRPGSTYPQLRLAHVCREWRSAAFNTPSLWSRLTVDFWPDKAGKNPNGHAKSGWSWRENLHNFLRLSRNGPLDVKLLWLQSSEVDSEVHAISAALFETSARWKSASLVYIFMSPAGNTTDHFFAPIRGRLPSLETLHLSIIELSSDELHQMSTSTVFRDTPRLRNVSLAGRNVLVDLPWHQLVRLVAFDLCPDPGDATIAWIARGIARSQHLTELNLSTGSERQNVQHDNAITTRHSSISRLILGPQTYRIVDAFILPALRRLEVSYVDAMQAQSFDEVHSLILRSGCAITSLKIMDFSPQIAGDSLRLCASQLTSLAQLQFRTSPMNVENEDIIRFVCSLLTPPKTQTSATDAIKSPTSVFPMLELLVIHNGLRSTNTTGGGIIEDHPISQKTLGLLTAMLNSRRSPSLPSGIPASPVYATACIRQSEAVLSLLDFNASEGWKDLRDAYQGQMAIYIRTPHDVVVDDARMTCETKIWMGKTKDVHDTARDFFSE